MSRSADRILDNYADWVRDHDTLAAADRAAIAAHDLAFRPLVSLLLPLGFGLPDGAMRTVASVQRQLYPRWQLCAAGDAAGLADVAEPRLCRATHHPAADVAQAVNAALGAAEGAFVAILRPGDTLPEHALFEVAAALGAAPETDLLYTDEDLIDWQGVRSAPRFKTGWDPDLMLAMDGVGSLAVWRRETLLALGGLRDGFGRAAEYDLALRAMATLSPERIRHLPAVLCHRPAEAAPNLHKRMFGDDAGHARRAVQEVLGEAARIVPAPLWPQANRVIWRLPVTPPLVSIIIPTRDRAALLVPCAWSVLRRTDYSALELIIVDNDSTEELTAQALRDLAADPRVRVLRHPGTFNFAAINNAAVAEAKGEIVVLLNNDVEVIDPGWLGELVGHALRPDVGAVGPKLLYGDGSLQHAGIVFGPGIAATHMLRLASRSDPGYDGQVAVTRSMLAVTGACLALRRAVFAEAGGFNAAHFAIAFNDLDLCLRLGELGYRVVFTPFAELFHLESQSRGRPETPAAMAQEEREVASLWYGWRHVFSADPFHNPNLTCAWDDPLRLSPPRRPRPWHIETPETV